jgi:hypothetical protein
VSLNILGIEKRRLDVVFYWAIQLDAHCHRKSWPKRGPRSLLNCRSAVALPMPLCDEVQHRVTTSINPPVIDPSCRWGSGPYLKRAFLSRIKTRSSINTFMAGSELATLVTNVAGVAVSLSLRKMHVTVKTLRRLHCVCDAGGGHNGSRNPGQRGCRREELIVWTKLKAIFPLQTAGRKYQAMMPQIKEGKLRPLTRGCARPHLPLLGTPDVRLPVASPI